MSLKSKTLVAVVAAAATVFAVGAGIFSRFQQRKTLRFPYLAQPLSETDYKALAARPGWRALSVDVGEGISLRGLTRAPSAPGGPWVLFFNGNSSTMLKEGQELLSAICQDTNWGAAVFAYRGYDGNPGKPSPEVLERDAWLTFQELLRSEHLEPKRVHIVAFSLGTSLATSIAARAHGSPPGSLTLLAPLTQIDLGNRTDLKLHRYETTKSLRAIANPTLVIHSSADQTLPIEQGRAVAAEIAGARLVELPALAHLDLLTAASVVAEVRGFIGQNAH